MLHRLFIGRCRKSVFNYIQDWVPADREPSPTGGFGNRLRHLHQRLHRIHLVDFAAVREKDPLYQGFVVPYCRCGTPLSDHEVALGYDEA